MVQYVENTYFRLEKGKAAAGGVDAVVGLWYVRAGFATTLL